MQIDDVITQAPRPTRTLTRNEDPFRDFTYVNVINSLNMFCCLPEKNTFTPLDIFPGTNFEQKSAPLREKKQRTTPISLDRNPEKLLPSLESNGRKTLILDLDETLVHSTFKIEQDYSFTVDIKIGTNSHTVYVKKRPGVDEFLQECSKYYEIVVFTASLPNYADAVMDVLDPYRVVKTRLFRHHCSHINGIYVKDLSKLGRDLSQVIIIDNSPLAYMKHPENAIAISSWYDDLSDQELINLSPVLERISQEEYVYDMLSELKSL